LGEPLTSNPEFTPRRIAGKDVPEEVKTPIEIDPAKEVTVHGTVEHPCDTVTCTFITRGLVRTLVAIVSEERREWHVNFGVSRPALYDLTACALKHRPAHLEVQLGPTRRDRLSITSCVGNPTVHIKGTTTHPNATVTCTLTLASGSDVQTVQSDSQGDWEVDYGVKPAGRYFFSATAPGEGKVSCDVTVK
jgi:hypothetical protein